MTVEQFRFAAFLLAVVTCVLVLIVVVAPIFLKKEGWRAEVAKNHPVTIAGIPIAGCSAFVVIAFFGAVDGPIKVSIWGLQLEGASGPVVIWFVTVLALALAARVTWGLKP